jgi:AraC-like DNA-binding protein
MTVENPPLPRFVDRDIVHEADSCRPLCEAVERGEARFHALARGQYPGRQLAAGQLEGVASTGYWDLEAAQNWGLPWHRNEGLEITLLESGRHTFHTEEEVVELKPRDLTITRPWQPHRLGDPHLEAGRLHWLILDVGVRRPNQPWCWPDWVVLAPSDLDRLTEILRHHEHPVWSAGDELLRCFQKMAAAVRRDDQPIPVSWMVVLMNELLLLLLDLLERAEVKLDRSLSSTARAVEMFLEDLARSPHLAALPWTLSSMAAECGLGATHFTDHCRQLKNRTPVHHLNACRLEHAADQLRGDPRRKVTDIALDVGFSSGQYFANSFRKRFGLTPTAYRLDDVRGQPSNAPA